MPYYPHLRAYQQYQSWFFDLTHIRHRIRQKHGFWAKLTHNRFKTHFAGIKSDFRRYRKNHRSFPHNMVHSDLHPCGTYFQKYVPIYWVQIRIHHIVRKTFADLSIKTKILFDARKVCSEAIMCQNRAYLAQKPCFWRILCLMCVKSKHHDWHYW